MSPTRLFRGAASEEEAAGGMFSSERFMPAEISQNTQCSLYSKVTPVPARLSAAVSPQLWKQCHRALVCSACL